MPSVVRLAVIAAIALGIAGCKPETTGSLGASSFATAQPRGATVAFDSIDGLPRPQFQNLVEKLNDEAQSRRLAVMSREGQSAYRVRGTLTATVNKGITTIGWTWDVFDKDEQRVMQITGSETAKKPSPVVAEAWNVADEAMIQRIAQTSMDQLTAFLTSPEVAPGATMQTAALESGSPEAAGIYRLPDGKADPVASAAPAALPASAPLPVRRPGTIPARQARADQPAGQALALFDPAL